ncbi:hypothetical protein [Spiroplasma endosymbiont of Dasysyrphus albostriatus]|uniref:hypothetical protein n=1 Tax=Spiroplasma endosymbiont of Dasysyrphus albostriatus TaxID=3066299 RepID=UPI0030D4C4B5
MDNFYAYIPLILKYIVILHYFLKDSKQVLSYNNQIYQLKEIPLKPIIKEDLIKTKKVYIPNKDHPWRYSY